MITIRTDEKCGKTYQFANAEYTDYDVTKAGNDSYFVVKKNGQWIGIFNTRHLVSVVVDETNK